MAKQTTPTVPPIKTGYVTPGFWQLLKSTFRFNIVNNGHSKPGNGGIKAGPPPAPQPAVANSPEEKVINRAADLWNEFLTVEGLQKNDIVAVNEIIHRVQDMMYANLYIKQHGKL